MKTEKVLMSEVATLYYRQNMTQQEIAKAMQLSRQTVSRLLSDAITERVVEIVIHDPQADLRALEERLFRAFGVKSLVCGVSGRSEAAAQLMTVEAAVGYLLPLLQRGGQRIAVSWGRTVQQLISALPQTPTRGNTVFPLFGATDDTHSYFSSNELARKLAGKLGAAPKCAWFPYLVHDPEDHRLLRQLTYYRDMQALWNSADLAIVGIGNTEILDIFGKTFGCSRIHARAIGDVATHFFDKAGRLVNLYPNTLCASAENLKNAKQTVAVACGKEKAEAIAGALRTGLVDTLITDEHTAAQVLRLVSERKQS